MSRRVLITGATGLIGRHVAQKLEGKHELHLAATQAQKIPQGETIPFDLKDLDRIKPWLDTLEPEVVIHTAAITSVDYAETHPQETQTLNVAATEQIGQWCGEHNARMVHFSTDFVFDGTRDDYKETDEVKPLSFYGRSKVESEERVRNLVEDHVIIRPILVYGTAPELSRLNFPLMVMAKLGSGQSMSITADQYRMPTAAKDVAGAVESLVEHSFRGTMHLAGPEKLSVYDFALETADVFGLDSQRLSPVATTTMHFAGQRPLNSGFDTSLAKRSIAWSPRTIREGLLEMKP